MRSKISLGEVISTGLMLFRRTPHVFDDRVFRYLRLLRLSDEAVSGLSQLLTIHIEILLEATRMFVSLALLVVKVQFMLTCEYGSEPHLQHGSSEEIGRAHV